MLLSQVTTHVTGTLTRIGFSFVLADWWSIAVSFTSWSGFFIGGVVASCILGPGSKLSLYRHRYAYMACFVLEIVLFVLARYAGGDEQWLPASSASASVNPDFGSKFCISFAMGVHNVMTTVYSGGPGRSSHFTGYTTDISIVLVTLLTTKCLLLTDWFQGFSLRARRKDQANWWRIRFFPPSLIMFVLGGVCGGATVKFHKSNAIFVPIIFAFLGATSCVLQGYVHRFHVLSK